MRKQVFTSNALCMHVHVCMREFVCVCVCTGMCTHVCVQVHVQVCRHMCVCVNVLVYVQVYMHMCVRVHACVQVYVQVCMHLYVCVWRFMCRCVCVCVHVDVWVCMHMCACPYRWLEVNLECHSHVPYTFLLKTRSPHFTWNLLTWHTGWWVSPRDHPISDSPILGLPNNTQLFMWVLRFKCKSLHLDHKHLTNQAILPALEFSF